MRINFVTKENNIGNLNVFENLNLTWCRFYSKLSI